MVIILVSSHEYTSHWNISCIVVASGENDEFKVFVQYAKDKQLVVMDTAQ